MAQAIHKRQAGKERTALALPEPGPGCFEIAGGAVEARLEKAGGGRALAIRGLDPGIPAGMTVQWVLQ